MDHESNMCPESGQGATTMLTVFHSTLAAAMVAADGTPGALPFVCLDERRAEAAEREGFPVQAA